ncbi:reverse transcriptase [Ostertagia ostertagi]
MIDVQNADQVATDQITLTDQSVEPIEGVSESTAESRSGPRSSSETSASDVTLEARLRERFDSYFRIAIKSHERHPIRRPEGEIPEEFLQLGSRLIAEKLRGRTSSGRTLTALNAAVYAAGKAITTLLLGGESEKAGKAYQKVREMKTLRSSLLRTISVLAVEVRRRKAGSRGAPSKHYLEIARLHGVSTTVEVERLLIRFKDELKIVNSDIKAKQDTLKRLRERKRGYPAVAREPRERDSDVPVTEVREHWKTIIGESQPFHPSEDLLTWARKEQRAGSTVAINLSEENWASIFAKVKPWKATGPDGIQGFWWKKLPEAKNRLKEWCLAALRRPHKIIPRWLCRGRIVLIPKGSSENRGPGDFRPIACLNTCYKILTAMIAQQILQCSEDVLPPEQVALRKGVWGCTHAHILDQTICKDALRRKKALHTLWVDMTKAFDSVSHGALKWILARTGVASPTRRLLSVIMSMQSVRYCGYKDGKLVKSAPLKVKRGVMQGDTLSPLLFCIAITPLSSWLRENVSPYRTSTGMLTLADGPLVINHLFYMDDLKVYSPKWDDIVKAREGIERVAGELGLHMNPSKCAVHSLHLPQTDIMADEMGGIPVLGSNSLYKYLGAEQSTLVSMDHLWSRVREKALESARRIMSSDLTVRQKVNGYNQVVIPKLKYAISCIIYGTGKLGTMRKQARGFDESVRKLLAETRMRFGHSCVARLYVNKEEGGLGLKSAEEEMEHTIVYTWCYLASNPNLQVPFHLCESLRSSNKRSLTSDFNAVMAENRLESEVTRLAQASIQVRERTYTTATSAARAISTLVHERWARTRMYEWTQREVASRVIRNSEMDEQPSICLKDSFLWSQVGWLSSEVLRNVWATQEGSLPTRASASGQSIYQSSNQLCRLRCPSRETAEHIVSACNYWRTGLMIERHDEVARVVYYSLKRKYGLSSRITNTHVPHVVEGDQVRIHWNDRILTRENLRHDRPDIVVFDAREKKIWIIEISISWYTRIALQELKKSRKYGMNSCLPEETRPDDFYPGPNLRAALQAQHRMTVEVVPLVVGTCGECTSNLRQNLRLLKLPDGVKVVMERMQRCAVLGTHRIIKSHLSKDDS